MLRQQPPTSDQLPSARVFHHQTPTTNQPPLQPLFRAHWCSFLAKSASCCFWWEWCAAGAARAIRRRLQIQRARKRRGDPGLFMARSVLSARRQRCGCLRTSPAVKIPNRSPKKPSWLVPAVDWPIHLSISSMRRHPMGRFRLRNWIRKIADLFLMPSEWRWGKRWCFGRKIRRCTTSRTCRPEIQRRISH